MDQMRATVAVYFRLGLETATIPMALPVRWADALIADCAEAPGDIVEVAWSRSDGSMIAALNGVEGARSVELAARWILCTLRGQLAEGRDPSEVIRASSRAVEVGGLGNPTRERLVGIADTLEVAMLGVHGVSSPAEGTA